MFTCKTEKPFLQRHSKPNIVENAKIRYNQGTDGVLYC